MKRFLLAALLFAGFACASFAQLPAIQLKDINGKAIRTDTLSNGGKPIVISFFATWCKPCNRELKTIDELYDEWRQETGVRIIAVAVDEGQNINKVKPLVDQNGWRYDVLLDPNSELRQALNIQMIPIPYYLMARETSFISTMGIQMARK